MVRLPGASASVAKLAWPLPSRATGACATPSTVKVTVPVGVPPPDAAATVAMKVTLSPPLDGFWLDANAVVVAICSTVCVSVSVEPV